jgi:hypothetical protein
MNKFFTTLLTLAALSLAIPANADHCTDFNTADPEVDAGTHYVDYDCPTVDDDCISVWIYEESNFIPGLQREDTVQDDTCHGMIAGDTVIL